MNVKEILGSNIRFYRNYAKISQEKLAEAVGISAKHLSSIENGKAYPSAELLEKLSDKLNISISSLFLSPEGIDNRHPNKIQRIVETELSEAVKKIILKIQE